MIKSSVTNNTNKASQSDCFIPYAISILVHFFILFVFFTHINTTPSINMDDIIVANLVTNSEIELAIAKPETLTINKKLLQKNIASPTKKIDNTKTEKKQPDSIKKTASLKDKVKTDITNNTTNKKAEKNTNVAKEVTYYSQQIQQEITQNWQKPYTFNVVKPSIVRIKLDAKGNIISIKLLTSSNNKLFDESIMQAIESSSPLETVKTMDTKTFTNNFTTINLSFNPEDLD